MINEVERYQGVVLRELVVAFGECARIGVADVSGRVDSFCIERAAFQIKYSTKRLSPWRFTYMPENLRELESLADGYPIVWAMLVCGQDGVVGVSLEEFRSIVRVGAVEPAWLRVSRSRNAMYRVGGALGDLPRAKARGVQPLLDVLRESRANMEGK